MHWFCDRLFYEAAVGQRILHGAGARECVRFYKTDSECSLVFQKGLGMFALTDRDTRCCLDMPGLETPPVNWTLTEHTFWATKRFKGKMCHGFRYGAGGHSFSAQAEGGHIYWQDSQSGLPCAFEFVGDDSLAFFFDVDSVKLGPQDDRLFVVPASCNATRCSAPSQSDAESTQGASATLKGGGAAGEGHRGRSSGDEGKDVRFEHLVDEVGDAEAHRVKVGLRDRPSLDPRS